VEKITRILAVAENPEDGAIVLDKAVAAARCFGAQVDLLIADATHAPALAALCMERDYDCVTLGSVHRNQEPMHESILRRTFESMPDLVIKAPAGARPLQRWTLHENDWALAHECPVPVILVRNRQWSKAMRLAAAVDVSDHDGAELTRSILHTAGFLAMGFHGNLDILYSEREKNDEAVRMERAVKLAQLVREFHVGCERLQVLNGEPGKMLAPLLAARQYDVLVLGAQSRRPLRSSILGGTIGHLIEASDGDVVLVKAPIQAMGEVAPRGVSVPEQRIDQVEQLV
jgi:nucleotide-binding universal stress UspA family protein